VPVFGGQLRHGRRVHIGRIAEDQVVALSIQCGEEVGLMQMYAVLQAITPHICAGYGEGLGGNVHRIHFGVRKAQSQDDGHTAGTCADLQNALYLRRLYPGREALFNKGLQQTARDEDTLIDAKTQSGKPGFTGDVGGGATENLPLIEVVEYCAFLTIQQAGRAEFCKVFRFQMQRPRDQGVGFGARLLLALAEVEPGSGKTAGSPTPVIGYRMQGSDSEGSILFEVHSA
jgi:hypothetical protein